MDKSLILRMVKSDVIKMIENLSADSLAQDIPQIENHLAFLKSLSLLDCPSLNNDQEKQVSQKSDLSAEGGMEQDNSYPLERKLKGGYIEKLDAYVPERIIRELELTHGDMVRVTPKDTRNVKTKRVYYHFELIEKGDGQNPNRGEMLYCIIEKSGDLWVCNKTLSGESIQLDDLPFTIRIKDSEVQEFNLSEGDIVDIAYYLNNPVASKVIWKHQIEDETYTQPLPSSTYKLKSTPDNVPQEHPDLKGKTVTLIGCIDRQATYRDQFVSLGANFQAMDGKEGEERVAALINKSDIVLIIIPAVSHNGSYLAKKHCKAGNIPFKTIDTIGTSSVVHGAINLAKEMKELEEELVK